MLSPRNAPTAATAITAKMFWLPWLAATPPMMTQVSLGTIGITESRKAIDEDDQQEPPVAGDPVEPVGEIGDDVGQVPAIMVWAGYRDVKPDRIALARRSASSASPAVTVMWPILRPGLADVLP